MLRRNLIVLLSLITALAIYGCGGDKDKKDAPPRATKTFDDIKAEPEQEKPQLEPKAEVTNVERQDDDIIAYELKIQIPENGEYQTYQSRLERSKLKTLGVDPQSKPVTGSLIHQNNNEKKVGALTWGKDLRNLIITSAAEPYKKSERVYVFEVVANEDGSLNPKLNHVKTLKDLSLSELEIQVRLQTNVQKRSPSVRDLPQVAGLQRLEGENTKTFRYGEKPNTFVTDVEILEDGSQIVHTEIISPEGKVLKSKTTHVMGGGENGPTRVWSKDLSTGETTYEEQDTDLIKDDEPEKSE